MGPNKPPRMRHPTCPLALRVLREAEDALASSEARRKTLDQKIRALSLRIAVLDEIIARETVQAG